MTTEDAGPEPSDRIDELLADWLQCREDQPGLLPGEFAATLSPELRDRFLAEIEELAELDHQVTHAPPRDLPRRYAGFRILRPLGRGGTGSVYEAEHVETGQLVALKVLRTELAGDARASARFEREARTAAALDHPHIARLLSFGREGDSAWIAMQRVDGHSLRRLLSAAADPRDRDHDLARRFFADPGAVARALADAADALEFAHRSGVVHRDVKPGNLMLGPDGAMTVLDFGLATDVRRPSELTRTGDFLGTPNYMSPEQAAGERRVGVGSDIYSLGAVLFECLTGTPVTPPGPLPEVLDAIRFRRAPDPLRSTPDAPRDLAQVATVCLQKKPEWRYGSAADLADDLQRFVDATPVQARPPGAVTRIARRIRHRPALPSMALASVVLVAGGLWFAAAAERRAAAAELDGQLDDIRSELALSPQGLQVFGGAVRRWFDRVGLGGHLPPAELRIETSAERALDRLQRLAADHSDDPEILRLFALASMDIGTDPVRTRRILDRLFRSQDGMPAPGDRALSAVQSLLEQDVDSADRLLEELDGEQSGNVWFFRALAHQLRHEHWPAIQAFDRALASPDLPEELRYFAYLHRGWCRTCPEISQPRRAEDDLLQAATLRPQYGSARLLWAGLRCLDPDPAALQSAVAAVTAVLTAVDHEPWVVLLTARVLLGLAEESTRQAGPVRFFGRTSPLAPLPLDGPRRDALATTALALADQVHAARPDLFEPLVHRVTALTLLGRHDDALAVIRDGAQRDDAATHAALRHSMAARVELSRGHTREARRQIDLALRLAPRDAETRLLHAELARGLADLDAELRALRLAADCLPSHATELPHIQERVAQLLIAAGRPAAALEALQDPRYGDVLSGADGPRARAWRAVLRTRAIAAGDADAASVRAAAREAERVVREAAPAPHLPLRALLTHVAAVLRELGDDRHADELEQEVLAAGEWQWWRAAALTRRGWLDPNSRATRRQLREDQSNRPHHAVAEALWSLPTVQPTGTNRPGAALLRAACAVPEPPAAVTAAWAERLAETHQDARAVEVLRRCLGSDPPMPLTPFRQASNALPTTGLEVLLGVAERCGADGDNSEARLLKATVLYRLGSADRVVEFLSGSMDRHPDDLRARFVLACAALQTGRQDVARDALRGADGTPLVDAATLQVVATAAGLSVPASTRQEVARLLE